MNSSVCNFLSYTLLIRYSIEAGTDGNGTGNTLTDVSTSGDNGKVASGQEAGGSPSPAPDSPPASPEVQGSDKVEGSEQEDPPTNEGGSKATDQDSKGVSGTEQGDSASSKTKEGATTQDASLPSTDDQPDLSKGQDSDKVKGTEEEKPSPSDGGPQAPGGNIKEGSDSEQSDSESSKTQQGGSSSDKPSQETITQDGSTSNTGDQTDPSKGKAGSTDPLKQSPESGDQLETKSEISNSEPGAPGSGTSLPEGAKAGVSAPTVSVSGTSGQGNDVTQLQKSDDGQTKGDKSASNSDDPNPKAKESENPSEVDNTLKKSTEGTDDTSVGKDKQPSEDPEKVKIPPTSDSKPASDKEELPTAPGAPENKVPGSEQSDALTSNPTSDSQSQISSPSVDNLLPTGQESGNHLDIPQGDSPSVEPLENSILTMPVENYNVKSAMLKNYKGLKITGECNAIFSIFFVPYIHVDVDTKANQISITSTKNEIKGTSEGVPTQSINFKSEEDNLQNECVENKTFKIVVYLDNDVLYVKWKVYDPSVETQPNTNVDVRKYQLTNFEFPITSIQVHNVKVGSKIVTLESKNYTINDDVPEKCEEIASDCFLHGNVNIERCYKCSLLYQKKPLTDQCYNYLSTEYKESLQADKVTAQSEDEINYGVIGHIDNILDGIFNVNDNNKELKKFEELSDETKNDILLYCNELKESDVSGTLEEYALGAAEDVYTNLTKLITNNMEDSIAKLKSKLMNPAICLKDVNKWGEKKTGLVLPELSSNNSDNTNEKDDTKTDIKSDEKLEEGFDGVIDLPLLHENELAGYTTIEDYQYCNNEYCDRLKDKTSCISKINVEDQGNCATSWLFASKLHLDTIGCMKGHDNFSASALYVANCSKKDSKDKCLTGSNPLEFLNIIDENKFLPTTSNLPYSYKKVGNECPQTMENWTNLWKDVKLLKSENNDKSLNTNGYISYQSKHFKDNFNEYANLIKHEIQNKGSVIAYVNSKDINSYDFNGNKVHKLCGSATPDMAVNIIGYGKYLNENNEVKSFWLVRNSWGKHWADEGNFKVDIETPENCEHNFIHTFATFNIYVPFVKKNIQSESEINLYYSKNSPDFFNNLYLKNLDADNTNKDSLIQGQDEPSSDSTVEVKEQSAGDGTKQSSEEGEQKSSKEGEAKEKSESEKEKKTNENPGSSGSQSTDLPTSPPAKAPEETQKDETKQEQVQEQVDSQKPSTGQEPKAQDGAQKEEQNKVQEQGQGGSQNQSPDQAVKTGQQGNAEGTKVPENTGEQEGKKEDANKEVTTKEDPNKPKEPSSSEGQQNVQQPTVEQDGQQDNQQEDQMVSDEPQAESTTEAELPANLKHEFMHILKQIKNGKVKMNLVKYGTELSMVDDHSCLRSYAINHEKKSECEDFCSKNWNVCKDEISPGYCLTKLYNSNNCYFCFV
ncbi:hypothetical protein YYE_04634 [Plasmodium vinckei vinckei]|uniref:Peptidase C1A papain C-terminal domain-containing protein n=2 Tax=Plasmodium vinckei TaxID=5860 RepID=A0A081I9U2_PLAVN|nr:hypothetical protein YYE_04634 [Plasmodium vinckei vinckei]